MDGDPSKLAPPAEARPGLPSGVLPATISSAAMIAQQVAGKAARDAIYLSSFGIRSLPAAMAAAAVLSLAAAVLISRFMLRHAPAKVVPVGFALNGVLYMLEWALSFSAPGLTAVALYMHTGLLGAAGISAFWSFINERFDPHTGKRAATWIAAGGTAGGVLGGAAAWGAASFIAVPTMLPSLGLLNVVIVWGVLRARRAPKLAAERRAPAPEDSEGSALQILRKAPYLRDLAMVVFLGAAISGLLDYVFSAEATRVFAKGSALLSFFSLFWLIVGIVSFLLQLAFGRVALEKLGVAVTIAVLPGVVVFGGALGLAVPGLWSAILLRGSEAASRNSVFRAAYELLYTPISEQRKRSTKTLIDVGFDRLGTVTASGLAILALSLAGGRAELVMLALVVLLAVITITRSGSLQRGYVEVLEESLEKQAMELTPPPSRTTREALDDRDKVVEKLEHLPELEDLAAMKRGSEVPAPAAAKKVSPPPKTDREELVRGIGDLLSGDLARAGRVLKREAPLDGHLVAFVIVLLADKQLHRDALIALRRIAPRATGQLVDALVDPSRAFDIRRRIPRVLVECETQEAADGLLRGARDERFEVRYECGRALAKIVTPDAPLVIPPEKVTALVKREVELDKQVWKSQESLELDEDEHQVPALIDRLLLDRIDRSVEHVFTLLALNLNRDALRLAFKALHEENPEVRGTALEYLETVLPDEIRDEVWPYLGEARPMRPRRPAKEIFEDLSRVTRVSALTVSSASPPAKP